MIGLIHTATIHRPTYGTSGYNETTVPTYSATPTYSAVKCRVASLTKEDRERMVKFGAGKEPIGDVRIYWEGGQSIAIKDRVHVGSEVFEIIEHENVDRLGAFIETIGKKAVLIT